METYPTHQSLFIEKFKLANKGYVTEVFKDCNRRPEELA